VLLAPDWLRAGEVYESIHEIRALPHDARMLRLRRPGETYGGFWVSESLLEEAATPGSTERPAG
jgi:hypothetical protein